MDAQLQDRLAEFVETHPRLWVLTGAGCSTESGIPDYRDREGEWKHARPTQFQDFVRDGCARRRYWARSAIGWPRVAGASPNRAHRALAHLQLMGHIDMLVTQNVDGLHQKAGSSSVVDLHGKLDDVVCLGCERRVARAEVQRWLTTDNPELERHDPRAAPDGDVRLEGLDWDSVRVRDCPNCGGLLKPDVVFFGESVPRERVRAAFLGVEEADAVLVVGSSLMVFSGYRFCRRARELGKPVVAVNLGVTRADAELAFKVPAECGGALTDLVTRLSD